MAGRIFFVDKIRQTMWDEKSQIGFIFIELNQNDGMVVWNEFNIKRQTPPFQSTEQTVD